MLRSRARRFEPRQAVFGRPVASFVRCGSLPGDTIIAHCVATFMRIGREATPLAYRNTIAGVTETEHEGKEPGCA